MKLSTNFGGFILIYFLHISLTNSLHLKGSWRTSDFFKFLAKFGIQKTDPNDRLNSQGYIYGNITTEGNYSLPVAFVVVDKNHFTEYNGNRTLSDKNEACQNIFKKIDGIAYDSKCYPDGSEDFLRKIPCPKNGYCADEDSPDRIVKGYQFMYGIRDINQPRFWYVSMVSCHREGNLSSHCLWKHTNQTDLVINYDIWLVNGNPYSQHNPLEYQFSFENHDTVEMYMFLAVAYLILVLLQVYAMLHQRHCVTRLFGGSMILEFFGVLSNLGHSSIFAINGEGVPWLRTAGDALDVTSQMLFMLMLLLLAKGWAITQAELTWTPVLWCAWVVYFISNIFLFIWNTSEVDTIEDIDEYQTWPGHLALLLRLTIMMWFLFELRRTILSLNPTSTKVQFYLHFGASCLVWFIYLPIVVLISIHINPLWRHLLLLGITYSADFLAFAIMMHLLWPTRSDQYLHLQSTSENWDELEVFNEAPHILHAKTVNEAPHILHAKIFNEAPHILHTKT